MAITQQGIAASFCGHIKVLECSGRNVMLFNLYLLLIIKFTNPFSDRVAYLIKTRVFDLWLICPVTGCVFQAIERKGLIRPSRHTTWLLI